MTTSAVSTEIFSSERLAGFWQVRADGANYLGVFETDDDREEGRLSAARIADRRLQGMRTFALSGPVVRAVDACVDGSNLVVALERNGFVTGDIARLPLTAVTDTTATPTELNGTTNVSLSPAQIAAVRLPAADYWNVAGPLRPQAWAFSLSPICGSPTTEAIANTADGQAAILASDGPQRSNLLIPNAAHPQAWWRNGQLTVAFIRTTEPYRPFWSLARYSGNREPVSGALSVADGPERVIDLSRTLDLGAIGALAPATGGAGSEWLFGARSAGKTTELYGLVRRNGSWQVAQKWEIDAPSDRISVAYANPGWHVVVAVETLEGWTLRLVRLDA